MFHLTVRSDFAGYKRGDHIEDPAEVDRILQDEHSVHVIKVIADVKPAPPADKADAKLKAVAGEKPTT